MRQVLSAHRLRAHAYKRQLRGFLCGEVTAKALLDELVSTHTHTQSHTITKQSEKKASKLWATPERARMA